MAKNTKDVGRDRPVVLFDPAPRKPTEIFRDPEMEELERLVELKPADGASVSARETESILREATVVIGQTTLGADRLANAPRLRAIFNVEGNFLPNIDYEVCLGRGIHVLSISPVFCLPVAELGLAMCLDLARGMTDAHLAFRQGHEKFGLEGTTGNFLLSHQTVGIIGMGGLGRALLSLLAPFQCSIQVYDPWLPERLIRSLGCEPTDIETLLRGCRVVFVTASVTTENQGFLGEREFRLLAPGSLFILLSRAGVVDFDAMIEAAASGRIRVATDVFPVEPIPADHPARTAPNVLLSAHRAGALEEVLKEIGSVVLSDLRQILRGLPPQSCLRAQHETVARMRSAPVDKT